MNIIELPHEKYATVGKFFNADHPNLVFILAVIERRIPGKIFVDNENSPTVCLVSCSGIPYHFIAGEFSGGVVTHFLHLLKEKPFVKLVYPFHANHGQIGLSGFGFEPVARVQYRYKDNTAKIPHYINNSGYNLIPIKDEQTFLLCNWYALMKGVYGNAQNYLKNGIGFILWDAEKKRVASEAHGVIAGGLMEVGTITHEEYRGKQLSTIVCNRMIQESIKKGLQPAWTCDKANIASWKVAEHQGMDDKMEYTFHVLKER